MAYSLSTTWAATKKDFLGGNSGLAGDVVLTFDVAATTTIVKGQFIKLTSGYAEPHAATTGAPIGVAMEAVDNSTGDDGDKEVSVKVRGIVQVNLWVAKAGDTYDDAAVPFSKCGLSTDGTTPGQSVSCGADCTVAVGTMLSTAAVPVASATYLALVYIDMLGQYGAI